MSRNCFHCKLLNQLKPGTIHVQNNDELNTNYISTVEPFLYYTLNCMKRFSPDLPKVDPENVYTALDSVKW